MIVHYCFWMCEAYRTLEFSIEMLTMASRNFVAMDANSQREMAKLAAEKILSQGRSLGWQLSDQIRTEAFVRDLNGGTKFSAETLVRELEGLKTSFYVALQNAKFAYIPTTDAKYFENDRLLGDAVFEVFEEALQDVKDAGNCLALAMHTACVFHLMRIAELGLRRLAARLRVKLFDKGKRQQVEYATWEKVIERVHAKIAEARRLPAGPKKQAQLSRFAEAADHCTFMKDIFEKQRVAHAKTLQQRRGACRTWSRKRFYEVSSERFER